MYILYINSNQMLLCRSGRLCTNMAVLGRPLVVCRGIYQNYVNKLVGK